jgi:hypothetical protein
MLSIVFQVDTYVDKLKNTVYNTNQNSSKTMAVLVSSYWDYGLPHIYLHIYSYNHYSIIAFGERNNYDDICTYI